MWVRFWYRFSSHNGTSLSRTYTQKSPVSIKNGWAKAHPMCVVIIEKAKTANCVQSCRTILKSSPCERIKPHSRITKLHLYQKVYNSPKQLFWIILNKCLSGHFLPSMLQKARLVPCSWPLDVESYESIYLDWLLIGERHPTERTRRAFNQFFFHD